MISTSPVPPGPGHSLAAKPDLLAAGDPRRDLDVDVLAGRQAHALGDAVRGFRQRHRHRRGDVGADAEILGLERRTGTAWRARPARAGAPAHAAEGLPENVLEAAETGAAAAAPRAAGKALGTEAEGLELRLGREAAGAAARAGAAAEPLEAAEARLALGVDLAAVERLALVVLAKDLVGGIDLGKARRRLGIVLVGVGMQFLGEAPERALDVAALALRSTPNTS